MGDRIEYGQPIDRLWEHPHQCQARWQHGGAGPWDVAYLVVGELGDGRWYVDHSQEGTRAYPTEDDAVAVARNWMRRRPGEWEQVPCSPTRGWQPGERRDS